MAPIVPNQSVLYFVVSPSPVHARKTKQQNGRSAMLTESRAFSLDFSNGHIKFAPRCSATIALISQTQSARLL